MVAHLALVSDGQDIDITMLTRVAAALQTQVTRDFGPIWGINATVDPFARLQDVPVGHWPIIIRRQIGNPRALGFHQTRQGQPFALVKLTQSWSLTASHETLEMLADPSGTRVFSGPSLAPDQGRVQYILEVCDPCEDVQYSYRVNGVLVSDFYTPDFMGPAVACPHYSFTGAIEEPLSILPGGYISWFDPESQHVFQQTWFGGSAPQIVDLSDTSGRLEPGQSLRDFVDRNTDVPPLQDGVDEESEQLQSARDAWNSNAESAERRAQLLRAEIDELLGEG
jgi:hypothetical protein